MTKRPDLCLIVTLKNDGQQRGPREVADNVMEDIQQLSDVTDVRFVRMWEAGLTVDYSNRMTRIREVES